MLPHCDYCFMFVSAVGILCGNVRFFELYVNVDEILFVHVCCLFLLFRCTCD